MVAVLCVARNSIYKTLADVDCYDIARDVRSFAGGMPVIAHPPCRSWSAYCAHQAKPLPGEKELGPWCVEKLRECGGVLEHPAHTRLYAACDIPRPGERERNGLWSLSVDQAWWGDSRRKATWLCFSGIDPASVAVPFVLREQRGDRAAWNRLSKNKRAATPESFARWLVKYASSAFVGEKK